MNKRIMTGSGILLGHSKGQKKSSKNTPRTSLTPEVQANTTLKLFIEDVANRLKFHFKKHKSKHSKLFVSFFSKLSAEPAPIETLSALQIEVLSGFLEFLENVKRKLISSNPSEASNIYQLLTENLDSTADFLSNLLTTIEKNESVLNTLQEYVSVVSTPIPSSTRHKEVLGTKPPLPVPTPPASEKPKSNGSSRVFRKGKHVIYYYKEDVNPDFGFDLSQLASLSPTYAFTGTSSQSVKKSASVQASPAPRLAPALQKYSEAGVDTVFESTSPKPLPKEEPLPAIPLDKFAEDITLDGSTAAPTESDYIQFAISTLRKAGRTLQAQKASNTSQTYLLNLLSQPDVLTAIAQSDLPFFQNFAEFLGQCWANQTPTATLLQHQDDIVHAIVQTLQETFPNVSPEALPEVIETEKALQELEEHIQPITVEEPSIPELPDISEFISEVEDVVPDDPASLSAHDNASFNEISHPLPADTASLQSTDLPTSDTIFVDSPRTPETAFDYTACAANFLRQVILSLPNSTAGLEAQAYVQSLLNAPDLLYALASSNQRSLVELATTLETAKLSNTPAISLTEPLSEAVGLVAGDLLRHFRSKSTLDTLEEDNNDTTFTFSELVLPSSFTSGTPDLDDVISLSESEPSFEQPTPTPALDTSRNDTLADQSLSAPSFQEVAPDAPSRLDAPSDSLITDETSSTFEDSLLLDDSSLTLLEEPSTPTLDDLKLDTPQPESDLDFQADDLLLPEDDLLSEASSALSEPTSDSLSTSTLDTLSSEPDLTLDNSPLFETSSQITVSHEITMPNPEAELQPSPEASITPESTCSEETTHSTETLDTISELTFPEELLLDESGMGEMLDTPTSRQDLSQLSSLSDKADALSSDELSFSDTLDESLLADSPMLLDDTSPNDALSESPALSEQHAAQLDAPSHAEPALMETNTDAEPALNLSDLDFSFDTTTLDDTLPSEPTLESNEANREPALQELPLNDTPLLDEPSLRAESSATAPSEHESKSLSSSDFLKDESYESELAPISDFQLDELQQIFLDEAREYLEKLNADLLELDKFAGTAQPDLVNRVLRGAHTLKGSAAMVNLNNIRDLGHKMEDCLQVVRDNNLKVPRQLLDVCFKAIDAIGIMVENFRRTGEDRFTKAQPLMDLFAAYTKQLQETGTLSDTPVAVSTAPSALSPAPPEAETTDFQLDELQQIFLDEATEYLEKLNADMIELDKFVGTVQPDLVNRVLRGAHTLKGSAAMVNLKNISDLAHKMEDCLQVVRDNNLKVPRPLLDILFKSSDAIGTMLKTFRSTGKDALDVSRHVAILKEYMSQLQQTGEIKTALSLETAPAPAETQAAPKPKTFTEETVRIDIRSLNNLVNMSAELVISRNRLTNELTNITRLINKFMKERNHLAQVNKKILTTIQKNSGERADSNGAFSDILKEFSETEFDRFSDLDIISRDVRSAMLNLDETINELRNLSSVLSQNVVKVSGIANDLNREIVGMRMVPMRQMYTRFQRSFRDLAKGEGKDIIFNTEGEDTKLDKSVMEEIVEPVLHMVRNAIGHGIEPPDVRIARGKPAQGTLTIRAYQKGSRVILEVEDDGGGIPIDKVKAKAVRQGLITQEEADAMPPNKATELIFLPGFSTADKITELSGRGVGMDVVRNTIRQLKGTVTVETREGKGTKFTISLPITLAINQALLVSASEHTYAIPLELVLETLSVSSDYLTTDEDGNKTISIRGEDIEFRYLNELLGYSIEPLEYKTMHSVVVIGLDERKVAVAVEKLIGKEEIVVKSLGRHLRNVRGIIGATILGDGQVVVILDMEYLLRPVGERGEDVHIQAMPAAEPEPEDIQPTITKRKRKSARITVLHADDSPSVRKYVQSILKGANIDVISADDGLNALNRLTQPNSNIDIIVSDLEMPRMNGFEFVTEVRKMDAYKDIPFIIVTARAGDKHRRTGLELGANAFLNKPFDPSQLIETIESYIA